MSRAVAVVLALGVGLCAGAVLAPKRDARIVHRVRTVVHTRTVSVHGPLAGRPASSDPAVRDPELHELAPADAEIISSRTLPAAGGATRQIAVTWRRTYPAGGRYDDYGLNLYQLDAHQDEQRHAGVYHRAYAIDRPGIKGSEIYRIEMKLADVTGDGHDDLFVTEATGGTAGGFAYDLVATVAGRPRALAHERLALDNAYVTVSHGALVIYEGVDRRPRGIHCCWRAWRRTVKTWNGHALVTSSTSRSTRDPRP